MDIKRKKLDSTLKQISKTIKVSLCLVLTLLLSQSSFAKSSKSRSGYNGLYMGHSFFWPSANELGKIAPKTSLTKHKQYLVKGGGKKGSAQQLWEIDELREQGQKYLDTKKIDLLVMAYRNPENSTVAQFSRWFDYALSKNRDTTFMIALSWATHLHNKDRKTLEKNKKGADWIHKSLIQKLRKKYPKNTILFCPHSYGTYELIERFQKGKLPGVKHILNMDTKTRPQSRKNGDQLLNDPLGHPGELVSKIGALLWLKTLYDFDLSKADPIRARNLPDINLNEIAETLSKEIEAFNP